MTELVTSFFSYATDLPWLELTAMLLALAYVLLAALGSILCWPAAFVSTALYTYIFYDVSLLMDSALNIYYLVMAIYGYWVWQKDTNEHHNEYSNEHSNNNTLSLTIITWQWTLHLKACFMLTIISIGLGYVVANYTSAHFPYLDTFTTVFAIFATYLVTQKVLENWLYWVVIDAVSIYLYLAKDLMPTVVLFAIYILIATWGYFKWLGLYKHHKVTAYN